MPSNAYLNFLHIRFDVIKLIETHTLYSQNRPGRKNLGHLTRSAVVMLCAAWERYNEDLLLESIEYIANNTPDINKLSKRIKKTISDKVKADKNENKPIELAGEGWKHVWQTYAKIETELLNTPKSTKLNMLFNIYLGIENYTKLWKTKDPKRIDNFVTDRGNIAHNGNRASYITMYKLRSYQDMIVDNVIEIDSNMADEVANILGKNSVPWIKIYSKEIKYYKK